MLLMVLHVARGFSAQPTLGNALGPDVLILEQPLPEAVVLPIAPDVIWISESDPGHVYLLRAQFPRAALLVTVSRTAETTDVVELFAHGADLVLRDEGVLFAAAAIQSLARRAGTPAPMAAT